MNVDSPRDQEPLLDETTVLPYLARRGVISTDTASARMLGGGVSNVVLAIDDGSQQLVLKQARGKLQVAEDWYAPRERVLREAEGLRVLANIDAAAAPEVIDVDPDALTLTIVRAPHDWTDWKERLLVGDVDRDVAERLGHSLRHMQIETTGGRGLSDELIGDTETFDVLRVEPYHRTAAQRNPEFASDILAVAERMSATRECLVHGDFSPKNFLVGPEGSWVIDFEVAHLGDPTFDPAFLASHLTMKAIHAPQWQDRYVLAAAAFFDAYDADSFGIDVTHLSQQIGCLLLARVDGKSPAEYLDAAQRRRTHRLGTLLLTHPVDTIDQVWNRLEEALS
ncbi:phosphotransferase family protein [Microbacterium sp. R86528]|uniref:phosphotransferase family protein n=1 Tax=Microbacterium sp. R86528 TaxID=3093864 RepID=UPI0037C89D3D